MKLICKTFSSLAKVMPDREPDYVSASAGSALRGEVFSFQIACFCDRGWVELAVTAESELAGSMRLRSVELVPVDFMPDELDDDIVDSRLGLYPDRLADLRNGRFNTVERQWRALWVTVDIPENCKAGVYPITLAFRGVSPDDGRAFVVRSNPFRLNVLPALLPPQSLKHTEWLHCDAITLSCHVRVFSSAWWSILERILRNMAAHGINMALTPLFTPPLDTEAGRERPTVQLVGVTRKQGRYTFDFKRLARFLNLAEKCNIRYFEMSHLFTQWGAVSTPKIIAETDRGTEKIFGWEVRADSREYKAFLDAFLPELTEFLDRRKLRDRVYFHCSDEPELKHEKSYAFAAKQLRKHLAGFRIFDALSNPEFFRKKLVDIPVPNEAGFHDFQKLELPEIWTYYCCGPLTGYSNRFIYMTSSRNRIWGALLYYHKVEGFLHWGYNFYHSRVARFPIDPCCSTTAGAAFPAGDPFLIYPGQDGEPEDSIRGEVLREALQDQRALQLLERSVPGDRLRQELDKASPGGKMTMASYPRGENAMLELREKINRMIEEHCC